MRFITCLAVSVLFISLQTTLIPTFPLLLSFYDFLIPLIVFLTLFRSWSETLFVIIFAGFSMSVFSGAPLGIYVIIYIWIFIFFKNMKIYFHTPDSSLFVILVVISVIIEQLVFWLFNIIQASSITLSFNAVRIFITQLVIAGITSPMAFFLLKKIFYYLDNLNFYHEGVSGISIRKYKRK